jgi:hypothetical protein
MILYIWYIVRFVLTIREDVKGRGVHRENDPVDPKTNSSFKETAAREIADRSRSRSCANGRMHSTPCCFSVWPQPRAIITLMDPEKKFSSECNERNLRNDNLCTLSAVAFRKCPGTRKKPSRLPIGKRKG